MNPQKKNGCRYVFFIYSKVSAFLWFARSYYLSVAQIGAIRSTYTGLGVAESILISVEFRSTRPKKGREYLT